MGTVQKPLTQTQAIKLAELSPRQDREAPRGQRGLPGTVGPPHRPRPVGGPVVGGPRVFAECCSLSRVRASHKTEDSSVLAPGA